MIKCLGSMVSVLPMCSDAPGTVSEGMKSHLCRQETTGRWNLPSVTLISVSLEWGLSKPRASPHVSTSAQQLGCCRSCCEISVTPCESLHTDQL